MMPLPGVGLGYVCCPGGAGSSLNWVLLVGQCSVNSHFTIQIAQYGRSTKSDYDAY